MHHDGGAVFQIFKERGNVFDINEYADSAVLSGEGQWEADETAGVPPVLFLGKDEGGTLGVVSQWCHYTKRRLILADSPEGAAEMPELQDAGMLLIDGAALELPRQEEAVMSLMELDIMTVFLSLRDSEIL